MDGTAHWVQTGTTTFRHALPEHEGNAWECGACGGRVWPNGDCPACWIDERVKAHEARMERDERQRQVATLREALGMARAQIKLALLWIDEALRPYEQEVPDDA